MRQSAIIDSVSVYTAFYESFVISALLHMLHAGTYLYHIVKCRTVTTVTSHYVFSPGVTPSGHYPMPRVIASLCVAAPLGRLVWQHTNGGDMARWPGSRN